VPDRKLFTVGKVLLALSILLLGADSAMAYVGPGVDVSLIGQFMALLWLVVAACSSILLWPIYAFIRKIRGGKKKAATASPIESAPEETRAASTTDA
jgi:hypothetical protein